MTKLTRAAASLCSIFTGALLLAGCAVEPADEAPIAEPPATEAHAQVGSFVMHVRPRESRVEVRRLPAEMTGPARFSPQNFDSLPVVSDNVTGSGPDSTVELATTSVTDTYNAGASGSCPAASFCGDVQLTHFYRGLGLSAVYVQVTAITDANGAVDSTHKVTNGIASNPFGIDVSLGTWQYTSLPSALAYGTGATKTWAFKNPDDKDFYVYLDVKAALYPMIWWNTTGPVQTAPLVAGQPAILHYNYARNGACRGTNWSMQGYLKGFNIDIHTTSWPGTSAATYFDQHVVMPFSSGADFWFNNTDGNGCNVYDANNGGNFNFAITSPTPAVHFSGPNAQNNPYWSTNWNVYADAGVKAGATITVDYEMDRGSCFKLDRYGRAPAGTTSTMSYRFDSVSGSYTTVSLLGTPYGVPTSLNGSPGQIYVPPTISIPAGSKELWVYFESDDGKGCHAYDSNLGANYKFGL